MSGEVAGAARARLEELRAEFVDFVIALAREESPSHDPASQAGVRRLLSDALVELGFIVEHEPGSRSGGQLVARPAGGGKPGQLLLGHMDTVWPIGTLASMPVELEGEHLRGPGVFDMKAGLAAGIFALRALDDLGIEPALPPAFLITSDEEIGSPDSGPLIESWARRVSRAFVLEPALGPEGKLKTRRKGVGHFAIEVAGVSSHAGLAPDEGASAIHELAHVIRDLSRLADRERGITVNAGVIAGGTRANVVASRARAEVDVRVWTRSDAEAVEMALREIRPTIRGIRVEISGSIDRPPLERTARNRALWERAAALAAALGLELEEGAAGGASDGNLTSLHTATLDGLGAVGDGAHAAHEFVHVDRALERAALLAALVSEPELRDAPEAAHGG